MTTKEKTKMTTTFATSPHDTPVVILPWSYYDAGRTKRADWIVGVDAEGTEKIADLTIHHHKDRKQFTVRLGRSHVEHKVGMDGKPYSVGIKTFTMFQHAPLDDLTILTVPVARYSAKARDAAFEEALIVLRASAEEDAVARFFRNEGSAKS